MPGALSGVRVLDFTAVLAGPFATRMLADHGAEVIKVQSRLTAGGPAHNLTGYFAAWNRNKLGITLNLSKPEGVQLARRLVRISDILVENFSPRVMENWGLDYAALRKERPELIMLSMSGMGRTGPWRDYFAFGPTVQALSGMTYLTGSPGRAPLGLGYSYADHVAGLMGVLAVLAAVEHRQRTGEGQHIDLSETEAMCSLLGTGMLDSACNGRDPAPEGNSSPQRLGAPHGVYRCRGEDRWCAIAVFNDQEWDAFCQALGRPSWTVRAEFSSQGQRWKHSAQLDAVVEEWTSQRDAREVMESLQRAGVAAGVVQNASDLAGDPQLKARDFFVELEHPVLGRTVSDGSPIGLSETPAVYRRAGPELGQDNDYVYRSLLGLPEAEIERLTAAGVIF
ncbi:MAG: CoA transferase [Chloroflexi bacterium]|nr:CoA transferase [Chloroflexota bacterium]